MPDVVTIDGALATGPEVDLADDPRVLVGVGLFETMLARAAEVPLLDRHLARLAASGRTLGLAVPRRGLVARRIAEALQEATGTAPLRVRLTLTAAGRLVVRVGPVPPSPVPLRLAVVPGPAHPDRLAVHKTTTYAPYLDRRDRARVLGADHALLVDPRGAVLEADHANVFALVGGRLVTPPVERALPGVARSLVCDTVEVEVRSLPVEELRGADEVVLTNALRGAIGVRAVDDIAVGPAGAAFEAIASALRALAPG